MDLWRDLPDCCRRSEARRWIGHRLRRITCLPDTAIYAASDCLRVNFFYLNGLATMADIIAKRVWQRRHSKVRKNVAELVISSDRTRISIQSSGFDDLVTFARTAKRNADAEVAAAKRN